MYAVSFPGKTSLVQSSPEQGPLMFYSGSDRMDKDRVAGSAKEVKGSLKEAAGKRGGDAKLEAEGRGNKAEGKVRNAVGGMKDAVKK